jgi:imidazoleglycerol phosphate synthase glutamine amidotransferase subunit HisH
MQKINESGLLGGAWLDCADTKRFRFAEGRTLKIPHMGWNEIHVAKPGPHSYYVNETTRMASC